MADGVITPARIAIVGAGFAGLAAAVELAAAGEAVDVFEASRTLGGRARAVLVDGLPLDNGAHILVGAYRETLRLMDLVGAIDTLRRHPLHLEIPGAMRIAAPGWLPAPLHLAWALLAAQGLSWQEKRAAIRFMGTLKRQRFRLSADRPVAELLAGQPPRLCRWLWEPLCLAALNTPVDRASAQVFVNVLRDSLAADRAASDLMLPADDLGALFPEPAARYLEKRGSRLHRGTRIDAITRRDGAYHLDGHGPYEQLVLAVAPYHLPKLVAGQPELAATTQTVAAFDWQPIVTCYLRYPQPLALPWPMVGVDAGYAQWLLDLGRLRGLEGTVAAVISGPGRHQALDAATLAAHVHKEVAALVPGLASPFWYRVIAERRATYSCVPNLRRPDTATALPGLWLAGDYVAGDYPATLEGAVRSGIRAARSVLQAPRHQS